MQVEKRIIMKKQLSCFFKDQEKFIGPSNSNCIKTSLKKSNTEQTRWGRMKKAHLKPSDALGALCINSQVIDTQKSYFLLT